MKNKTKKSNKTFCENWKKLKNMIHLTLILLTLAYLKVIQRLKHGKN